MHTHRCIHLMTLGLCLALVSSCGKFFSMKSGGAAQLTSFNGFACEAVISTGGVSLATPTGGNTTSGEIQFTVKTTGGTGPFDVTSVIYSGQKATSFLALTDVFTVGARISATFSGGVSTTVTQNQGTVSVVDKGANDAITTCPITYVAPHLVCSIEVFPDTPTVSTSFLATLLVGQWDGSTNETMIGLDPSHPPQVSFQLSGQPAITSQTFEGNITAGSTPGTYPLSASVTLSGGQSAQCELDVSVVTDVWGN